MNNQIDKDEQEQKALIRKESMDQFLASAVPKKKGVGGIIGDTLLTGLAGAVAVPEIAVGLSDITSGGRTGKFADEVLGFRPKEAKEAIAGWKSEEAQSQLRNFQETEGFGAKLGYALKNPSLISNTVVESLPSMLAGGVVGRGIAAAAPKISPVLAGAIGEGTVGAGMQAESIRQQTEDGLLTGKQTGIAAATGLTTAGFGFAGGKLAKQLGIGDFDTMIASGTRNASGRSAAEIAEGVAAASAKQPGILKRTLGGAVTEGLLEELPQSVSETILQNEALGRPLDEGVTDAAALGLLSGAAMGGFAGGFSRNRATDGDITPTEDMGQEAPRLGLPNPNRPDGNQLGYQGAISDPNNPNWIEDGNPDYFNRGQGPDAANMRNLTPDPELPYNSELGGQFSAASDGTVFSEAEYNDYLAQQQAQARASRDAGLSDVNDITPVPEGYDRSGNDPRLPPPRSDFEVTSDGTALTSADSNTVIQNERAANAERMARRLRGEIQDNTPIPNEAMGFGDVETVDNRKLSERMGLDPNKGGLSAAAAIAVDSGASSVAADFEQSNTPTQSAWQSGMMDRLSNADQNNSTYARLAQSMQNEPTSVSEKSRLMREAESLPRAEVAAKQIKPKTRVLDEAKAQTKAYTPEGQEVQAQWDVVDASDLVTSNTDNFTINPDFPSSRQPRDRTRASSQQQVNDIASKLQPNLLGESPDVSTGAPFVGANDNVVDSGNGRTMAIRRVYQEGSEKAQAYRQFVNEQAGKFGLDTDAINMMQSPVLVRRNISDMNRDEFARAANKPTAARMSSTEQATSDAKNLPDASLLSFDGEGSMSLYQSQKYLKNFIAGLPKTEQGSLMDDKGALSREGKSRIEAAIVQDAYNNPRLVSAISEKLDNDTTNVLRAVTDKAPQISQINASIRTGDVYENTLARDIADATQAYMDIKNSEQDVDDYLQQDSLFDDGLTDGAKEILGVLSDNRRSAKAIGKYIQERINQVTGRGNPKQGGLSFDDDIETDAPNVLSNEPAPTNTQAATQLTDDNPTVNIPAPKKAPRELSDRAMVREMQKPTANNGEVDYKSKLNLSEGQNLGRLIMSSGRVFDDAVVKSMDDKGVTVEATVNGKRGLHKGLQYQTVDAGINNTKSYAKQKADSTKTAEPATTPEVRQKAINDYKLRSVEVQEDLAKRGLSDALYKKAGLKKNASFENLPIAEQAEAYANLVEDGTTPTTFNESYNDKVMRREKEAEERRKKRTEPSKAMQPAKSYSKVQVEIAGEMGFTENEDGEYDITDAQFDTMEGRVRERMEAQESQAQPQAPVTKSETNPEPADSEREKHIKFFKEDPKKGRAYIEEQGLTKKALELAGKKYETNLASISPNAQAKAYADLIEDGMTPMPNKPSDDAKTEKKKEKWIAPKIQEFKEWRASGKNHPQTLKYGRGAEHTLIGENGYGDPVYQDSQTASTRYSVNSSGKVEEGNNINPTAEDAGLFKGKPSLFKTIPEINALDKKRIEAENENARAIAKQADKYNRENGLSAPSKPSEPKFSRAAGLSETAELKDLLVVHNITSEGVLAATELGGLAAPSIAVIRSEVSDFSGYGEITLVADPLFITGKDMPTYDADIYSPRQPRPIFDINEKKFRDFENSLSGSQYNLRAPTTSDLAEGADRLLRSEAVQYEFLKSIGKEPKLKNAKIEPAIKAAAKIDLGRQAAADNPKFLAAATSYFESQMQDTIEKMAARAKSKGEETPSDIDIDFVRSIYFNEDGSANQNQLDRFLDKVNRYKQSDGKDYAQLSKDLTEKMRSPLIQRRFEKWATDKFNSLVDGKVLFKGFTPGGSRKYAPYNLENVVKEMTGKLNNGENFSYGAGSVRSVYANELKTLKDIQARREKIIPKEDFKKIKEESNQVFSDAIENLRPYYKFDADSWNYTSDAANAIADGAASIKEAFGTNKAAKKIIDDLTYYLSNLPTEYFEAKAQRAVQFNEFDTAIVPKDANPEAVKVLREAGVKIKRYDQKIEGDKNRIIAQQTKLMFSKPESERANLSAGNKAKGSTQTTRQQVISKLSDKFGKETIAKLMADGKLDIKVLSDYVVDGKLTIPSDVDGLYHNGKATLIADNLSDDMIIPTFLHELGGHGGMQGLMDKKAYDALMKDFDSLVKAGDPLAMQAKAMADKVARNEQDALDEYLPYLITLASRQQAKTGKVAGMINRMVMAIRSWLKNTLGVPITINSQDILSLAERMVNEIEKQGSLDNVANAAPQFSDPNIPDKQMQDVRDQYENTDQWMTAPNGKPTNLTENQWLQVRTPAFKQWFGDWEGDAKNASKVVDDNGEPMVMYHGSDNYGFSEFNTENDYREIIGSYFTNSPDVAQSYINHKEGLRKLINEKGHDNVTLEDRGIYSTFLSIKNPKQVDGKSSNWTNFTGELKNNVYVSLGAGKYYDEWFSTKKEADRKAQEMELSTGKNAVVDYDNPLAVNTREFVSRSFYKWGYEGVIAKNIYDVGSNSNKKALSTPSTVVVAFNPNQIKSATDNAGTFDNSNPDIRYSRAAGMNDQFDPINMARESKQRLYDWASSAPPGKLSWWHKTIGTMYNLAQRNPYFKPVFDNTEKFINDVSYYASKASEFAPRLLPQLDSIRDITKSAIGAKDNEALSKPIFEGTLLWGRDLDGKAVLIEDWRKKVMATSKQDRLKMLQNAGRITPAQEAELATLNNIQANRFINGIIDEEVNAGLVWTDNELRSKFNLDDKQIELYREFRAATDKSLDSLTRSDMLRKMGKDANDIESQVMEVATLREAVFVIEQHINSLIQASPKKEKALKATLKEIKESKFRTDKLKDDGYAPLSRFGQYTVDVVDADGNREYFGMFESAYEARKMKAEMDALYLDPNADPNAIPEYTVTQGALSNEEFKLFAGVTPETAELFGEMLGLDATGDKAADEAFQEYLKRTKNNRSAMKRLMHRKGIKGYSEDVGRVLASFIYSNARHTSAALNMGNLDRSIADIPKGEGQLKDAAVKLAQYIKNPQEEGQLIRGWMFAQYLGGSIASAAVNLTQPIAVSFPYLSQFGGAVKAASQLKKSSGDWIKAFTSKSRDHFEPDLLAAIERAEADGTLSPQEVHNLLKQASGKNPLRAGDGTKVGDAKALASNSLSRASLAWGVLFSGAEQINRRVTFVAAYRLAKDQGMDDPADFATKSIKETQFVYNKASRMNWGRGAVGGTLMTFKTYTVSYMELMHRLWTQGEKGSEERKQGQKAVGIMLGTLFLLGGAGGLPFMEDAEDLIDGIGQIMGYNLSSKKWRQDFLDEWTGEMMGDFLDGGISSLSGSPADVSGRLGLGNLIPGTGIFKERTSNSRDVLEIVGPAGDFVGRVATGTRDIAKGVANLDSTSLKKGALEFAPTAVRNAVKGTSMATSGIYKDTKGYKVADVSPIDAAFKFVGFQPRDISKIQEANYLGQSSTSYYNLRASNIRALWAAGVVEGNESKVADAKAAVKDWNEKNPNQKIIVKPNDIARRVREMRMDKSERVVKRAPKSSRGILAQDLAKAGQ